MQYNWQHPNWPHFEYDLSEVQGVLYQYALEASDLLGGLHQLPEEMQTDALIDLMVSEALKTSEIEGEFMNYEDVRSSIKKELGIFETSVPVKDPKAIGIAQLMMSLRNTFQESLSSQRLFEWHKMIMADSSANKHLEIGTWRTSQEPMQIVSGAFGHERVHFEAPPSDDVAQEMSKYMEWFNSTHPSNQKKQMLGPVRAAIAHLYFESIHPFADGNGRIGRALSEKVLSQELGRPIWLSLSSTIHKNKKEYYAELTRASRCDMNITSWITYFVKTIYQAQADARLQLTFVLRKAQFWKRHQNFLNERQEKVLKRMLKAGVEGFTGGISANKYMKIAECSKATATRDLVELLAKGVLTRLPGSGRSTRYELVL